MSDITIGALSLPGFNTAIGANISLSGLTVALGSPTVTGTFPARVVGLGGFKITLPDGVFDVDSVDSTTTLTLTSNYTGAGGTVSGTIHKYALLRIYAAATFIPSGSSEVVQIGAPHSNDWFRRYAASVINDGEQNVLYLPEIVLPATTNSSNAVARYFAGIYSPSGQFIRQGPVSEFRLSTTTPTSWAVILGFNSPPNPAPPNPENFYTAQEIDARFPTGLQNELLYFASAGNVLSRLSLDAGDFQITAGVLESLLAPKQIQEEGSDLPIRTKLNFIGSGLTASDNAGNDRTDVTVDSDLNAIASNSTNGIYARTGAGTVSARTITGTANRIGVTNGDGVSGNPTLDIGSDVVTLTGTQTLTNKTLTAPRVGTSINDTNGNEIIRTPATGSAVNDITVTNAATGNAPSVSATGDDTNIGLTNATKGTGDYTIQTNSISRAVISGSAAEAYFGNGTTNAAPANYSINGTGGSGSNIAGAHVDLAGGKGTGTGIPGHAAVRYPLITSTGTTLQSLSTERFPLSTSLYTNITAGTAVSNSVAETGIFSGATASSGSTGTIEAGSVRAGTAFRLRLFGTFNTTGTPTIRFRVKLGSVTVADSGVVTSPNNAAGLFFIDTLIYVNAIGATGLVRANFEGRLTAALAGALTPTFFVGVAGEPTVDFTASQGINATAEWGTASVSNNLQLLSASIDRIR